jgi:hypothetical protein
VILPDVNGPSAYGIAPQVLGSVVRICTHPRIHARPNLVQHAWFAALAVESGCEWITTNRDYARFAGLAWRGPF